MNKLVIGIDYGTDSCRALIVDTVTGEELATKVAYYPRWAKGLYCNPSQNQYRQHPKDYIETIIESVTGAIAQLQKGDAEHIVAIGIDTTGSTPALVDKDGIPLALLPEYAENPNAMFVLWKDHTAIREAEEINQLAYKWETDFTSLSGGIYSSEWFWAKALHVLRADESIRKDAYSIIEHCDWMPAMLTGNQKPELVKRSRCAAGHKGMWAEEWGGYPSQEYLSALDTLFDGFRERMSNDTFTSDVSAGKISDYWAEKLGVPKGIDVAVGILDAHAGALGAEIKANTMVKIVGTSTCDIVVVPKEKLAKNIPGISGQVDGSVLPGMFGLEAGQSAFGDLYAWFKNILSWTLTEFLDEKQEAEISDKIIARLSEKAKEIPLTENSLIALDWMNGRRTPFVDPNVKGLIAGITLGTTAPDIFKSLVEATVFGSKAIFDHFKNEGVEITEVIGVGGISKKSPYVMQTLSDVLEVPIKVAATEQAGALGVAMGAAVAAEAIENMDTAQKKLGKGYDQIFYPKKENKAVFDKLYAEYRKLGNLD